MNAVYKKEDVTLPLFRAPLLTTGSLRIPPKPLALFLLQVTFASQRFQF